MVIKAAGLKGSLGGRIIQKGTINWIKHYHYKTHI